MKRILLIGSVLAVMGLLIALALPALAHGPANGTTTSTQGQAWEDMYDACQNGDWEAMEEAARQMHSEDYDGMPCHEEYDGTTGEESETSGSGWSGTGGSHMGGGMMGW